MFAPAAARSELMSLYAFNAEVARIREVTSEPLIGQMKLEWWREVVVAIYEGGRVPQGNPVVEGLNEIVKSHNLSRVHFDELLNCRAEDMTDDAPKDVQALETYAEGTSTRLLWLALEILSVRDESSVAAARHVGIAWSLTGIIRAVLFHARANRTMLPQDLMTANDLAGQDALRQKNANKISQVVRDIGVVARLHLEKAGTYRADVDRRAVPVLLLGTLTTQYLEGLARRGYDVFDPRHALQRPNVIKLTWNALRGRYS
jgi:NADH dehydrogenase [ubiquinone] 1 alpha subcomplex assembly factor 6